MGQVDIYGTNAEGIQVHLGKAPMPPRMKAREIASEMFGSFTDGDDTDAELCFWALEQLIEWMTKQGWTPPAEAVQPTVITKTLDRDGILGKAGDVVTATFPPLADDEAVQPSCPVCRGNDAEAPCAYPGQQLAGCLRDIRIKAVRKGGE